MGNCGGAQIEQAVEQQFLMLNEYNLSWQQCSRNFFKLGCCGRILARYLPVIDDHQCGECVSIKILFSLMRLHEVLRMVVA